MSSKKIKKLFFFMKKLIFYIFRIKYDYINIYCTNIIAFYVISNLG